MRDGGGGINYEAGLVLCPGERVSLGLGWVHVGENVIGYFNIFIKNYINAA